MENTAETEKLEANRDLLISLLPFCLDELEGEFDLAQGVPSDVLAEYLNCTERTVQRDTSSALKKMRRRAESL